MTIDQQPMQPVTPVVRTRSRSSRWLDLALAVAALLAVGGVAFGVGRATAPVAAAGDAQGTFRSANGFRPDGSFDPNGAPGRGGLAFAGGLSIDGTVTALSADSITLKLANGQEMTFALDSSTSYHQATAGSASDVAVGDTASIKVKGGGRFVSGNGAAGSSPAPGASGAPGTTGSGLQATDVTVTH